MHSQAAGRGHEALGYLAGYVQKSAISDRRILADDARGVTIAYTESGTGKRKTLTLSPMAFIARVLSHALPAGLHRVRYFGWMHPRARTRLCRVQTLLAVPLVFKAPEVHPPLPLRCPRCGQFSLKLIGRVRRFKPP